MKKLLVLAAVAAAALISIYLLYPITASAGVPTTLTAGVGTPTLDGMATPGEWTSDTITTLRGVTLQAMMDEEFFYVLATWPDTTMSVNKDRWTWDGQQWNASEDEDRIAFIWEILDSQGSSLNGADGPSCQTMCHPGEGMATGFGRVDVWHGKATRFLPVGYTDDKYWDTDGPDGRHSDSGSGSGGRNRTGDQTGPEFRAASGPGANVTFLADDQAAMDAFNASGTQFGTADMKVAIDGGDVFAVGDTVPGRILMMPTGNRASVQSIGRWDNDVWTVEFRRQLSGEVGDGGEPEDFTAVPGGSVRFTTEIFDNLSEHENHPFSAAGSGQADFMIYTLDFPLPTQIYFAQTGNGGGFTADHVFTNPVADRDVRATMNLFEANGEPLPIDIASVGPDHYLLSRAVAPAEIQSSVMFEVPPLGSVTISTTGLGDVLDGAAEVLADNLLGGVIRFAIPNIGIAGVGQSESLSAFIIPVRHIAGDIRTGIALHHTKSNGNDPQQTVTLELSLHDETGMEVATRSITDFPERGHMADFIDEIFPDFFGLGAQGPSNGFSGTLVVEVQGGEVAATGLELGNDPGEFTTLPVTPIR